MPSDGMSQTIGENHYDFMYGMKMSAERVRSGAKIAKKVVQQITSC